MNIVPCRGCGADIAFIRSLKKNKWLPINPEKKYGSEIDGKILIEDDGRIVNNPPPDMYGYVPHWDTCPKADEFRRARDE